MSDTPQTTTEPTDLRKRKWNRDHLIRQRIRHTQTVFLDAYRQTGSLTNAAKVAKIHPGTHMRWRKQHEDYETLYQEAHVEACILLEEEARRRAVEGVRRYKFFQGGQILHPVTREPYYELEYSDTLLCKLLSAHIPERYSNNTNVELKGRLDQRISGNIEHKHSHVLLDVNTLPIELCEQLLDAINAQKEPEVIQQRLEDKNDY